MAKDNLLMDIFGSLNILKQIKKKYPKELTFVDSFGIIKKKSKEKGSIKWKILANKKSNFY